MTSPLAGQIRVLLIEDNPPDARLLQELLREADKSLFVVEWADRLSKGLERLGQGRIDIVLLDLELPDSSGLSTFQRVREQFPDVPVILLTGLDDQDLALQAVSEGAQEYLIKGQIDGPSASRHIRHAIGRHQSLRARLAGAERERCGKVLGVMGAKGGVGTTTLAVNVAAALARQKHKVIIAEFLPCYGSLALALHQTPPVHLGSLLGLEAARIDRQRLDAHLVESPFGFRVLFAPPTPETEGSIAVEQAEAILKGMARLADWTVLDLDHRSHAHLKAAIQVCNFLLLVVEPEPVAILSAKVVLRLVQCYGASAGSIGLVVVNRAGLSSGMMLAETRDQLGCRIVGAVPPAAEMFAQAHMAGKLLVLAQPESRAASAICEIAARLTENPVGALCA